MRLVELELPSFGALIWIGRLIILEYALLFRAYNTLPTRWPGREEYTDLGHRLLEYPAMERGAFR